MNNMESHNKYKNSNNPPKCTFCYHRDFGIYVIEQHSIKICLSCWDKIGYIRKKKCTQFEIVNYIPKEDHAEN